MIKGPLLLHLKRGTLWCSWYSSQIHWFLSPCNVLGWLCQTISTGKKFQVSPLQVIFTKEYQFWWKCSRISMTYFPWNVIGASRTAGPSDVSLTTYSPVQRGMRKKYWKILEGLTILISMWNTLLLNRKQLYCRTVNGIENRECIDLL